MDETLYRPGRFSASSFTVRRSSFVSFVLYPPPPLMPGSLDPPAFILLLLGAGFIVACVVAAAVAAAMSRHHKSAVGPLRLEGREAVVVEALEPEGAVLVCGELWRARAKSGDRIAGGGRVRIVGARGHWLEVEVVA